MQAELTPSPENIFRRLRPFFPAEIVDLPSVELRQHFFAQVLQAARVADHALDASAIRARISRSKAGGQPGPATLDASQEARGAAAGQVASGKLRLRGPGPAATTESWREHVDGRLRKTPVGRDLAAEHREQRRVFALELEFVVARDARGIARLVIEQGPHAAIRPDHLGRCRFAREVTVDGIAEVANFGL